MKRIAHVESGLSLVELLVALVIGLLLMTAVFSFFIDQSQIITNQNSNGEMWQRGRNAIAMVRQAVESAGFGLPSALDCPNGIAAYNSASGTSFSLTAVTASAQSSYTPYGNTLSSYSITTVTGGGPFGNAPVAQITKAPSVNGNAATIFLNNVSMIKPDDIFVVELAGQACIMGQVTAVNNNSNGTNGNNVGYNSGKSAYNEPGGLAAVASGIYNLTGMNFVGNATSTPPVPPANFYDLGSSNFQINIFRISDQNGTKTPTLYLTQYNSGNTPPQAQELAEGVVDIQVLYGVQPSNTPPASYGITEWVTPENYNATSDQLLALRVAMLVRSTRYEANAISPATISMPGGATYKVPTTNGPGCLHGDCRHYTYHLFDSIIPVRNSIQGAANG